METQRECRLAFSESQGEWREVETREALSQHYLELRTSPPAPTRTRELSAAGRPPEWLTGTHGEAVLRGRGGRASDAAKLPRQPQPLVDGEGLGDRKLPRSPAKARAAVLRTSEAAAQRAAPEKGGEQAAARQEGEEEERRLCLAVAGRVADLCGIVGLGAGPDVHAAEIVKAAAEAQLDALEVARALGLALGERSRAPEEVAEYTARVVEAVEKQQATDADEGARECRRETHLLIRCRF